MKLCNKCKTEKPLSGFQKNVTYPDGLQPWCRECFNAYSRDRNKKIRTDNPTQYKKMSADNRRRNWFHWDVYNARYNAKKYGVVNTLTVEEWKTIVSESNQICHLCGKRTTLEPKFPHTTSIDHVIPTCRGGGNVKENVKVACSSCNKCRHSMLVSEFRALAVEWAKEH